MQSEWGFRHAKGSAGDATDVVFSIEMKIGDPIKAQVIRNVFSKMADSQIEAFETEIGRRQRESGSAQC